GAGQAARGRDPARDPRVRPGARARRPAAAARGDRVLRLDPRLHQRAPVQGHPRLRGGARGLDRDPARPDQARRRAELPAVEDGRLRPPTARAAQAWASLTAARSAARARLNSFATSATATAGRSSRRSRAPSSTRLAAADSDIAPRLALDDF